MNLNHFVITGNVARDLELRYTASGMPVVTYTVACNNVWYDDDGKKHEECDFIPVSTTAKQAERDAKYLRKGSPVAVEGRIRSWYKAEERKGGFNFQATRVQYLGKPSGTRDAAQAEPPPEQGEWVRSYAAAEKTPAGRARVPGPNGGRTAGA